MHKSLKTDDRISRYPFVRLCVSYPDKESTFQRSLRNIQPMFCLILNRSIFLAYLARSLFCYYPVIDVGICFIISSIQNYYLSHPMTYLPCSYFTFVFLLFIPLLFLLCFFLMLFPLFHNVN